MVRPKLKPEDRMTVEEFLAFTASRPDEERWELIEGVPVMNASPTNYHQLICGNVLAALMRERERTSASWCPLIGTGTRVPIEATSLPQPDVLVLPAVPTGPASHIAEDALVLFEVLSQSNNIRDLAWRRRVYASIPSCMHYVTIRQSTRSVVRHDRDSGWSATIFDRTADVLVLPALGARVRIPLVEIYRFSPVAT